LLKSVDLVDEKREGADLSVDAQQRRVEKYFNSKVRPRIFEVGKLVLKRLFYGTGALGLNWEGPYAIIQKLGNGTFKFATIVEA